MPDPVQPDEPAQSSTDGGRPLGMPPWVKVVGVAAGVATLLAVVVMLIGGVEHGPGRHAPGSNAGADHTDDAAPIEGAPQVPVSAAALRFDPDRLELPAGFPLNLALTSADILHDLVVDEIDFRLAANRDETAVGGLVFDEPGTYVGYCSVPGHRDAGMGLEFVVGEHGDLEQFFRNLHG